MNRAFNKIIIGKLLIAILTALVVYVITNRMGMTIIAFFLMRLLLEEKIDVSTKTIMSFVIAITFFYIGRKMSFFIAMKSISGWGQFAFTFTGGFINGIVELETYLLFTLFPMKLILCKNLMQSLRYILRVAIICLILGGLIQGSYVSGWQQRFFARWQHTFYI